MIKKSYKNKRKERVLTLKNISLNTPDASIQNEPTSGVSSHYYPTPMIKETEENLTDEELESTLSSLSEDYAEAISKDSYYNLLYSFLKISSEKNYFQKMKDLISTIVSANPLFYEEDVDKVVSAYYLKYKESIRNNSMSPEKDAYLKAYETYKQNIIKILFLN